MTATVAQTTTTATTTSFSSSASSPSSSARRARRDGAPPSGGAAVDGGWGWAVVVACFMAQFLAYGSPQSVGVLYPGWLHLFQEGKGMTAWVGSLVSGVGLIIGPVCSVCVVYFGARPVTVFSGVMVGGGLMLSAFAPNISFLIFSYGIVVGIGCGLVYSATLTITCLYFDKRRGLALGIVTTGGSVGGFVYATAKAELIDLFGLDGCLLIVGALALNIIACAGPMRPLTPPKYYLKQRAAILERAAKGQLYQKAHAFQEPIKVSPEAPLSPNEKPLLAKDLVIVIETKELAIEKRGGMFSCTALVKIIKNRLRDYSTCCSSTMSLFQDRVFMSLCISLFLFSLGAFPPLLFMEDVAQSEGLSDGVAAVPLVSLTAISAGAGKMALGMLADLPRINSVYLYAFTLAGSGLGLLLIPITKTYLGLQMLCTALGFLSGNWSLTSYVTTQLVGMERLTEAHGILMFFGGFGIMLGPPVVGWFYDMTQSYDVAFYLSGVCVLLGSVILFASALQGCCTKPGSAPQPEVVSQTEFIECTVAVAVMPEPAVLYATATTTTTRHMVASVA